MSSSNHSSNPDHSSGWPTTIFTANYFWLVIILVLLALLYIWRYQTATQTGATGDDARYLILAESFLTGQPYRIISFPDAPLETVWPPGYPALVLAPAALLVGTDPETLRLTSVILGLINVLLAYHLLQRYLDQRWLLFLVTTFFALNHWIAGLAGMVMSETAYMTFVLLTFLLLQKWHEQTTCGKQRTMLLVLAGLTQSAAVLTRYQGVALVLASGLWLLSQRKWRPVIWLGTVTVLALLPFVLFMGLNLSDTGSSIFAIEMVSGQLVTFWSRAGSAALKYVLTIPLVMIPLLGPTVLSTAQAVGLGWLVNGFHLLIFTLTALGVLQGLRRRELLAYYASTYFFLILLIDNHGGPFQNEGRYSAMLLPFAYLYFTKALVWTLTQMRLPSSKSSMAAAVVGTALIFILLGRNFQQAQANFRVVDLSLGAAWIQDNTAAEAIIMTHDPVERFIHLRRRTVPIPPELPEQISAGNLDADYILVAPPLRLPGNVANVNRLLTPSDEQNLLPQLQEATRNFEVVWENPKEQTIIFRVKRNQQ